MSESWLLMLSRLAAAIAPSVILELSSEKKFSEESGRGTRGPVAAAMFAQCHVSSREIVASLGTNPCVIHVHTDGGCDQLKHGDEISSQPHPAFGHSLGPSDAYPFICPREW